MLDRAAPAPGAVLDERVGHATGGAGLAEEAVELLCAALRELLQLERRRRRDAAACQAQQRALPDVAPEMRRYRAQQLHTRPAPSALMHARNMPEAADSVALCGRTASVQRGHADVRGWTMVAMQQLGKGLQSEERRC